MPRVVLIDVLSAPIAYEVLKNALVKEGIDCKIISFEKEMNQGISYSRDNRSYREGSVPEAVELIRKRLRRLKPSLSGTTVFGMTFYDYELAHKLLVPVARAIKQEFPNIPLVGGGPAFNTNPKGFFKEANLDYAFRGEAEKVFPQMVKAIATNDLSSLELMPGLIRPTRNGLIIPSRPILLTSEEVAKTGIIFNRDSKRTVITYTERGCPYSCVFCSVMRRGRPVPIQDEEIIAGLKHLARSPKIKNVRFVDDNLFYDKQRVYRLFQKIIDAGLAKRFRFGSMATITAFLTKEKTVDRPFMRFLRKAHFTMISIGTEALNDNMLKELKHAPYTSVEAIKVNDALRRMGFTTASFMLAGGIETRAKDFIESYYRAMKKDFRGTGRYKQLAILRGHREDPYYKRAMREGAVIDSQGNQVPHNESISVDPRHIVPKDADLKPLFSEHLRNQSFSMGTWSMKDVLPIAKKLAEQDPNSQKTYRKLLKLSGEMTANENGFHNRTLFFATALAFYQLDKRKLPHTAKNVEALVADAKMRKSIVQKAESYARQYNELAQKASKLKGIERLRAIQHLRKKTGLGLTALIPARRRKN